MVLDNRCAIAQSRSSSMLNWCPRWSSAGRRELTPGPGACRCAPDFSFSWWIGSPQELWCV